MYTIEPDNVEIFVFYPDPAGESSRLRLHGNNVENKTANRAKELAAEVTEFVILPVEALRIDHDHGCESIRQKGDITAQGELEMGCWRGQQRLTSETAFDIKFCE